MNVERSVYVCFCILTFQFDGYYLIKKRDVSINKNIKWSTGEIVDAIFIACTFCEKKDSGMSVFSSLYLQKLQYLQLEEKGVSFLRECYGS